MPEFQAKGAGVLLESMLGALGALVVLAFVFASFLAFVPLVMAAISILTTFLALNGLTHITAVSQIVEFLIALIGLGVAIDYSLLVVTRWREERAHGRDNEQAVLAAMTSAGRAVLFSGLTVGIGLLALVVLPVPFLRSAGIGGVLIPLISVTVALTLLPVILASIGPRLDWPRIRTDNTAGRGWSAWARFTARHRGLAAIAGTATLIVLMLPSLSMHVGEPSTAALAQSGPAHTALGTLEAGGVPSGTLTPIDVLARQSAAPAITHQLAELPGVHAVVSPATPQFRRDDTALVTVLPTAETNVPAGQSTVIQSATLSPKPRRSRGCRLGRLEDRFQPRRLRQLPADARADRAGDVRAARPGVPLAAPTAQGSGDEPRLAGRRLRRDELDLAARTRQPGRVGNPRDRGDHHVGPRDGLRVPVRSVNGL